MENPKIRFKGFTKDWEQRRFGEITELKSASRVHKDEWTSNGVPFYRSSDVMTAINGTENEKAFISEELYEKLSKVSGKLEEGDILVTGGGSVGNPYIVPDNKPLYTKDADLLWIKNKGKFHPYFLYEFFFSPTFRNYLGSISHVGTIAHYTITQLSDTPIGLPIFEEQKEVGEYFQSLDRLITLHQRKCEQTKKLKKYMLQKMFPRNGAKVPEIRFDGFTYDWEQRKLGELVKEGILEAPLDGNHGEKHPTSDEYVDSGIPFLMASDIHNGEVNIYSCKYITKERAERLDKGFARNGDVLLTHKATIGETAILSNLMTEYAMLTPQVTYYRIKNEERLNREYLYSFFNSLDFQTELKTKAAQSTRPYIGITAQQNLKIILPAEIDEQIRIGLYFRNLDHLITLHQRQTDFYKKISFYYISS